MKKLFTLVLVCVVALSVFAGCSGKDETQPKQETPETTTQKQDETKEKEPVQPRKKSEKVELDSEAVKSKTVSLAEIKQFVSTCVDINEYRESGNSEKEASYYINEKRAYNLDYTVNFDDGSAVSIPCKYADVEGAGWTTEYKLDEREMSESTGGTLHSGITVKVKNADERVFEVGIFNFDTVKKMASECSVASLKIDNYTYNYTREEILPNDMVPSFIVNETINNKSTLKEVIEKLGIPGTILCKEQSIRFKSIPSITLQYEMTEGTVAGRLNFEFTADGTAMLSMKYEKIG